MDIDLQSALLEGIWERYEDDTVAPGGGGTARATCAPIIGEGERWIVVSGEAWHDDAVARNVAWCLYDVAGGTYDYFTFTSALATQARDVLYDKCKAPVPFVLDETKGLAFEVMALGNTQVVTMRLIVVKLRGFAKKA